MFLPAPDLFLNSLSWNLHREVRLSMADVTGRGEPSVRRWLREKDFPPGVLEKWLDYLDKMSHGRLNSTFDIILNEPRLASTNVFKWKAFSEGMLSREEPFLPYTLKMINSYCDQWLCALVPCMSLDDTFQHEHFKNLILTVAAANIDLPTSLQNLVTESRDWEELVPVVLWLNLEYSLYFLAMAEAEYLWLYYQIGDQRISNIVLPKLHRGKVRPPVKLFFEYFFNTLIDKGLYKSHGDIAQHFPRILPLDKTGRQHCKDTMKIDTDSGWRELRRAKYQGEAPSFETFKAWIDKLIPDSFYPSPEDQDLNQQLLCDAFGAARIADRLFKEASSYDPENVVMERFQKYDSWFLHHQTAIIAEHE